jgi:SecD/SecF fusion protein
MLHFSRSKTLIIIGLCLLGVLLAVPNFLGQGALPAWVPQPRVNLGLDLQGGSYLLLEVDMKTVIRDRLTNLRSEVRQALAKAQVAHRGVDVLEQGLSVQLASEPDAAAARKALAPILQLRSEGPAYALFFDQKLDGARLILTLSPAALSDMATKAVEQSVSIVRRRIDETGVNEPAVARQGRDRVLVALPGVSDPDRIKRLLGKTAKMTFRLVAPKDARPNADTEVLPYAERGRGAEPIAVQRQIAVDGANLTNANPGTDPRTGEWVVHFELDRIGAKRFADVTTHHVGEPFAIVLDGKVISAPVIREPITGGRGQISGNFTVQDATDLAVLLRAGALPAPLTVVEERTIGPSLGADSIRTGLLSIAAGFVFLVGFILATYGLFGVFAAVALVANLALTLTGLSLLGATLTLPGIAGILLALGMAVDANILINERAREEARKSTGVISALETGFRRAYRTIVDANATTLIKMLILFAVGTGAIRGFAITISMGILISMFTAIVLVRLLISFWLQRTRPKALKIATRWHRLPEGTTFRFMRARYSGLVVSAVISLAAVSLAYHPGLRMGVEFAGGVLIEARAPAPVDAAALRAKLGGLGLGPVQVQEFGSPNDVLLRFEAPHGAAAEQQEAVGKARAGVLEAMPGAELRRVEVVGPTIGSELLRDGLWALGWAALAMFAYIVFRFEWPFAVGAIVTMFLDLTKTIGFFALTGFEFNLTSIAAILTIMGFSINDKIVVYDRVRENLTRYKKMPLAELINLSINETLTRTIGTSVALFLAIAPLAFFGGPALREFAIVLLFGLVLATSSSIFIAAPILLNLGEKSLRRQGTAQSSVPSAPAAPARMAAGPRPAGKQA